MNSQTPRVWIATFVGLVFTIGLLAGVVVERTWLGRRGFGVGRAATIAAGAPIRGGGPAGRGRGAGGAGLGRGGQAFGPPPTQYVADLARAVQLTDDQRTEVLALLHAQESLLRGLQDDARQVFVREQNDLHDKIAAVLTPDQVATFRTWANRRLRR
ncbi:MAG: hypothetical protein HQ485_02750 [Acidobacteria bacterium]|nr:hypothetical protein [Acidobacteriota bacterium]